MEFGDRHGEHYALNDNAKALRYYMQHSFNLINSHFVMMLLMSNNKEKTVASNISFNDHQN